MNYRLVLFFSIASLPGIAQDIDSLLAKELESVVVTAQYEPQSARQSVYRIRTIPVETIRNRGAVKLQDVLNTELNMRFSQDAALGGSNLTMQGLSGQNVKVLVDGAPLVGRQGTSNEININQINVNTIERVEIIEGPMSVAYGADALAGVINIITKKPEQSGITGTALIHEETVGNEYGIGSGIHNESVSLGYTRGGLSLQGDLTRNYFGGWIGDSTGREKTFHPKTQWLSSARVGYGWQNSKVYYRLDYLNEDIYNPANFVGTEALEQHYFTRRFMHQLQGEHAFSEKSRLNLIASYTDYARETQTSTVNASTGDARLALGPGLQDETRFRGVTVRPTWQLKGSPSLSLQAGADLNHEAGSGGRIQAGTQEIGDYALFLSGEWQVTKAIQLRPGLRSSYNTAYAAPPVVPSLNAKLTLNDRQSIRLSYGRGFRAPSLRELYFDFIDANHSIKGNTDLQSELSHSVNGSWSVILPTSSTLRLTSDLAAFFNHVDNMIAYGVKPSDPLTTTYINIDTYKTTGVTWNGNLRTGNLEAALGFAYTGRYNQLVESQPETKSYTWSPEANTTVSYQFPKPALTLSLFAKYTGVLPYYTFEQGTGDVILAEVAGYTWADATIKKTWKAFSLSAGARNIFNVSRLATTAQATGAHSGGGQLAGYGRSYFLELTYSFSAN